MPPESFWNQTPRETAAHLRALAAQRLGRLEDALWGAWHTAALDRHERLPDLPGMLRRMRAAAAGQDPEEQMAIARAIGDAFGAD